MFRIVEFRKWVFFFFRFCFVVHRNQSICMWRKLVGLFFFFTLYVVWQIAEWSLLINTFCLTDFSDLDRWSMSFRCECNVLFCQGMDLVSIISDNYFNGKLNHFQGTQERIGIKKDRIFVTSWWFVSRGCRSQFLHNAQNNTAI